MSAIRIRRRIDSDTLTLPELREFIGRTVDIVIEEQPAPADTAAEFWASASKLPTTQAEFAAQQEQFRRWRAEPRFEPHWPMIDLLLARDFEKTRKWAEINKAIQGLGEDGYDFDAWKRQREFDANQAANPPQ
jgi:hypothetical protein